jgi:hypothetical protein
MRLDPRVRHGRPHKLLRKSVYMVTLGSRIPIFHIVRMHTPLYHGTQHQARPEARIPLVRPDFVG